MSEYRKGTARVGAKGDKEPPGTEVPLPTHPMGYLTLLPCPVCGARLFAATLSGTEVVWCSKVGRRTSCGFGVTETIRVEEAATAAADKAEQEAG